MLEQAYQSCSILLKGTMPRQINEDRTRKEMIDPQLEKAGWYLRDHFRVKKQPCKKSLPPIGDLRWAW
jgi:type I site-specific restriction endonuclease